MAAAVVAQGVVKEFFGVRALDSVDLVIERGKIHCIIGENGAGKSTLIKILTGLYRLDEGAILIDDVDVSNAEDKKLFRAIAYVPQEINLFSEMTVAENLFIPFKKSGINKFLIKNSELEKLSIPYLDKFRMHAGPDELVKDISISDKQLLQIARAMADEKAEVLLLDEPTTSLTTNEIEKLFSIIRQLKEKNKAIVFISHKLEEIFAIGDEITILRNGVKVAHSAVSEVDIPWVITQMAGRKIDDSENYRPEKTGESEVLLEVKNLTGERFRNINFKLHKGEILGFSGLVGSGRTEIMQAIFGYLPAWSGTVTVEGKNWKLGSPVYSVNNGLIYLPEERKQHGILPNMGVLYNISIPLLRRITNGIVVSSKKEKATAQDVVAMYNIKIAGLNQFIQYLSGGNQQKAIIGRSMFARPKILVFDEPTKGIDVGSKIEIYKLMKKFAEENQMGIILISSEMEEVLKCSNRVIAMYDGKMAGDFAAPVNKTELLNAIMGLVLE
ncbi:MAG: sugar ABC transporter ATP-binding protein [Treponema sp.]|jgi:ribose transport system ATP-binding protein|nr:sugar ABC transporter ATP-binding protein [Treponema sp.]